MDVDFGSVIYFKECLDLRLLLHPTGVSKRRLLQRRTNDKARQILVDAIEDPKLTKVLLSRPRGLNAPNNEKVMSRYLIGILGAAQED